MAKSLKSAGLQELAQFRRRVIRQLGMERITQADHDQLLEKLNEIEAKVIEMHEEEEGGDELW